MVRYNNIISRLGNKEQDIKHFKHLLPTDVKTVVEPFGGSFAVIKHFYKDCSKYKFHINDTDETLFYMFRNYQYVLNITHALSDMYYEHFYKKHYEFKKLFDYLELKPEVRTYICKTNFIRGNIFKCPKFYDRYNPIEKQILDNALFTNLDYGEIFEQYKDDPDAFVFLDPPYLFSDNSNYASQIRESDMTQMIVDILEYLKICRCKVLLIINKLNILSYLFKDYIKGEYHKIYQISKKKSIHLIISNYDI